MTEFSGYEKMPDTMKKLGLEEKEISKIDKILWVVTEKIHGANFSFVYENHNLKYAKRREYLSWGDDFFGFQVVVGAIEEELIRLFEHLYIAMPGKRYIIYGELFGGGYPHPSVPAVENIQPIQTGVYYSPGIHFCAFDIAIVHDSGTKTYLDYQTAISLFEKFGVLYAKPLFIGRFNEAMNFNTRINTSLPLLLGLPLLTTNLIEGIVIKPYDQKNMELSQRVIIKRKNGEFDEEDKFHQAKKWSYIPDVSSKAENLSFILDEARTYVTLNRLESAISKVGALYRGNSERILEIESELLEDILTDFTENNPGIIEELSFQDKQWIRERLRAEILKLIHFQGGNNETK